MFLDRTTGEVYSHGRLTTTESDNGNVSLIAYGWLKIAEYNESRGVVTVFTGHASIESKTVVQYLNEVADRAEDRGRDLVLSGESPEVGRPNDGVQFIGNYISMSGRKSAVEKDIQQFVRESLNHLV